MSTWIMAPVQKGCHWFPSCVAAAKGQNNVAQASPVCYCRQSIAKSAVVALAAITHGWLSTAGCLTARASRPLPVRRLPAGRRDVRCCACLRVWLACCCGVAPHGSGELISPSTPLLQRPGCSQSSGAPEHRSAGAVEWQSAGAAKHLSSRAPQW